MKRKKERVSTKDASLDRARVESTLRSLPILKAPPLKSAKNETDAYQKFQHDIEVNVRFLQSKENEESVIALIIRHSLCYAHLMDSQRIDVDGSLFYSDKKEDDFNHSSVSIRITRVEDGEYVVESEISSLESQPTIYYNPYGDGD
jgi:hypothetical protein